MYAKLACKELLRLVTLIITGASKTVIRNQWADTQKYMEALFRELK